MNTARVVWSRGSAALAALGLAAWCLLVPLGHALPAPQVGSLGAWHHWLDRTDPLVAAATLFRLAALIPTAVLALAVAVELVAVVDPRARTWSGHLPAPLTAAVVLMLGASACSVATGGQNTLPGPRSLTITRLESPVSPQVYPKVIGETVTHNEIWRTRPGDNLWKIAQTTIARRGGDPTDNAAVQAYLTRLISADRDELSDPSNPSRIYPGQVFELPD